MKNEDSENLINNLTLVINNQLPLESLKQQLNPNYTDSNGNGCFHFLAEYSFEKFCLHNIKLNKNEKIVDYQRYNEIKNKYTENISLFTKLLLQLNCDIFSPNKMNQNPLYLSISKKNYIIAKEYFKIQQNLNICNTDEYYNILQLVINNGNCFNKDYIELVMLILSTTDENKNNVFNSTLLNNENQNYLTPLIALCKNFSDNIYDMYNEIIKIKAMKYINKDNNNQITIKKDESIINNIKNESLEEIINYMNNYFYPLIIQFIELGANVQTKKESAFIYLMNFPIIQNLRTIIKDNIANVNFLDEYGNTPLINLINNKENIIQISEDVYLQAFTFLINNDKLQITQCNNNNISAFNLCLMKGYYPDAKIIFEKFKHSYILNFNAEILNFIINNVSDTQKFKNILNFAINEIDINIFNYENNRSLLHYICLYLTDDNKNTELFKDVILYLTSATKGIIIKDKFNRSPFFYFFIDANEKSKDTDPFVKFEFCLKSFKFNINDVDIFGNNLLFYAIKSKAYNCIKMLINSGINISIIQNNNENSVYSLSLFIGNLELFSHLYNITKNQNIFNHKIYKPFEYKINKEIVIFKDQSEKGQTLYDFLNKEPLVDLKNQNIFNKDKINIINKINKKISFKRNIFIQKEFNYFNFLYNEILKVLDDYTKDIIIKIDNENNNINNIYQINEDLNNHNIISDFLLNYNNYINERINSKREIISENLFRYCLSKNHEKLCKFIINENYNLISICYDLILFHKFNDINECIKKILSENDNDQNKLLNLKNDKLQTIYHILPNIHNNLFFCKNLKNHKISNIFDFKGNTPMYYACQNFNIIFIETFSNYSFSRNDNNSNIVNYNLFLETNGNKTPLEILYEKLNKKDEKVVKLIIDISINMKKVYFIPTIKYLIQNYSPYNNNIFRHDYKKNLFSIDYLKKIIGLFQFYTKELNGSIMIKDEFGNDPFFISALDNNYNFLFNILLEEHNITLNSINNDGKSIIHLIVEISGYLNKYKEDLLKQAIESGFDFNIKDNEGMLPVDYAYLDEDINIINILLNYYKIFGLEIPKNRHIIPKNKKNYDFCKDSDIFYNQAISLSAKIDKFENLNELVSKSFKYDPNTSFYKVCLNKEKTVLYSINLVKKDFYNFDENQEKKFCIQIIEDELNQNNEYILITVDNFNINTFRYLNFDLAEEKFKQIFKDKTGNNWDDIKDNKSNFKNDYLKYYILDHSYEEENAIYDYLKITIKNLYIHKKCQIKGNEKLKNIIYYLLVKAYQNKFSLDEISLNVEKNTRNIIQKYKKTAIQKATSILFEIKKLLLENNKDEIYMKKRNYLINSYNDLIPYSHKSNNLNLFDEQTSIDSEISRLTTYYYLENVLKIFLGAIYNLDKMHPLDYIINCLGCEIEEIPKPQNINNAFDNQLTTEDDYIYNYVFSTGGKYDSIRTIYKIIYSKNDKNFNLNNYQNRYIFCHGTKVENIIGILSQGLKIAPVQAKYTGSAYGHGIYLSDFFSLSLAYCYPRNVPSHKDKVFMFLVEVAVGRIGQNEDTNIVRMNLSFEDAFITNEGYYIFKNSNRINNGGGIIVAHDETNVRIKYLVEIN